MYFINFYLTGGEYVPEGKSRGGYGFVSTPAWPRWRNVGFAVMRCRIPDPQG